VLSISLLPGIGCDMPEFIYASHLKLPIMSDILQIIREKKENIDVVYLSGRLDANTSAMADTELQTMVSNGSTKILINLANLEYISSSGLRILLVNLRKLRKNQGDLKLACLKPMVKEIIHLAGFDRIFTLYETENAALQSFVHIVLDEKETQIMDVLSSTILIEEDRRLTEESLRQSEKLYRTIFENTGTGMVIVQDDMTIFLANSMFEKMVGYSKEELEEVQILLSFVVRDDLVKIMEYHDAIRINAGDLPRYCEFRLKDRNGNVKNIYMIQDLIPETPRRVNSLIDITELRKIEEDLRHALTKQKELLVLASHELRNPLQMPLVYLNMILDNPAAYGINADARAMLEKSLKYIDLEREMVELVIRLSGMYGSPDQMVHENQPHYRKISPEQLIQSHITMLRYSSDMSLAVDIPKELAIATDSEYFYRIFESVVFYLIWNSPPRANIEIGYRDRGTSDDFTITHRTLRISTEIIPTVFTPFYAGDESKLQEKYGFIGMSLPVAKKLAEVIGGDITVTSEADTGTIFTLSLPKNKE
jgi:anti-anti-sigma factor